ncbi:hypothetical protein C3B72_12550 [Clostridium tetani]|nr:hypothetical protein C3B72_12550 [Clostridium tetani]RXI78870.1 hypothetical protein DP128_00130 [Clostridium tetani]
MNVLFIFFIAVIFIFMVSRNNSHLAVPNPEDLSSITFINVVNEKGIERVIVYEQSDIYELLEVFKNSKKTNKESISDLPNKTKFTAIFFNFTSGGNSLRSIYEENEVFYIHQPYSGVFKLGSNDLDVLDEIIEKGEKESISMQLEDILKDNLIKNSY